MPTLDWIGKDAVIRHHKKVPFRLLEPDATLSHGDPAEGNLIVQGDNLHALKALLPKYAGRVKCIYIDPPYNTGNEGWIYNDKVNSPEINKWLGQTVGKEAEDLSRHDKWLCMMYPRLVLLKQFLREDGAIFVSIDDNEVASLRLLMDEIFGKSNFIANLIWEKRKNRENRKALSVRHDHVLCYSRSFSSEKIIHQLPMDKEALARYKNQDDDPKGPWKSDPATAQAGHGTLTQFYDLIAPNGKSHKLPSGRCWVHTQEVMNEKILQGSIWFGAHGNNVPRIKTYLHDKERGLTPETILFADSVSTNEKAKNDLKVIFSGEVPFETPKPHELIQRFIQMTMNEKDSIILDSFAGSGTTGHAVLKQNVADGGNRKFILVEMEEQIAASITAERVRRVAGGYTDAKGKKVPGLGSGFQFCRLSTEPLFNEFGDIRDDVTFAELADFVWFAETGMGYAGAADSPLLGTHEGRAIVLLFNGILGDRRPQGGNILTKAILDGLPKHDGPKIIYAAATRLGSAALQRANIVFKQTPYAIEV